MRLKEQGFPKKPKNIKFLNVCDALKKSDFRKLLPNPEGQFCGIMFTVFLITVLLSIQFSSNYFHIKLILITPIATNHKNDINDIISTVVRINTNPIKQYLSPCH